MTLAVRVHGAQIPISSHPAQIIGNSVPLLTHG
jgi:hypothetical protein